MALNLQFLKTPYSRILNIQNVQNFETGRSSISFQNSKSDTEQQSRMSCTKIESTWQAEWTLQGSNGGEDFIVAGTGLWGFKALLGLFGSQTILHRDLRIQI